ncbi:hypothetical protein O9G_006073 [Rozella allomycis CSF55]|uniref:Thioredoxin-like fold domain-containing protein n=1 Tax=Rozella allomycis (strain CSF55) TaxID=988480 RepID=A0A075AN62_ROZAC|nr:hypothetical protein O9G_006073 [Rozella allomycis CSF55]|eukprot:EPZ31212.1 hypothetical protein O9G_006073 [Rozella allomycis CSF55]
MTFSFLISCTRIKASRRNSQHANLHPAFQTILTGMFPRFKATKFVKIESTSCIPNYPDRNVPTILLYREGDLRHQIIGMSEFGGKSCKAKNVEWALSKYQMIKSDLKEDELHLPDTDVSDSDIEY